MDTSCGLPTSLPNLFGEFRIRNKGTAHGDVIGVSALDNLLHYRRIRDSSHQEKRNVYRFLDGPGAFPVEGLGEWGRFNHLPSKAFHHEAK